MLCYFLLKRRICGLQLKTQGNRAKVDTSYILIKQQKNQGGERMSNPQLNRTLNQVFKNCRYLLCAYASMLILMGMSLPSIGYAAESQNTSHKTDTTTTEKRLVPDVWYAKLPVSSKFNWVIDDAIITHDDDVQIIYSDHNITAENPDEKFNFVRVYSLKQQKIVEEWIQDETGAKAEIGPLKEGSPSKGSIEDYRKTHTKRKIDFVHSNLTPFPLGDGTFLKRKEYESNFSCYNYDSYFERTDASGKVLDQVMLVRFYPELKITHPFCGFEGVKETYTVPVRARSDGGMIVPLGDGTYLVFVETGVIRFDGYMKSPYIEASNDLVLVPAKKLKDFYEETLLAWQFMFTWQLIQNSSDVDQFFKESNTLALERAAEVGYLFAKDALRIKQNSKKE